MRWIALNCRIFQGLPGPSPVADVAGVV